MAAYIAIVERSQCPDPGDILYGSREPLFADDKENQLVYEGTTITYSCPSSGDKLVGNRVITCLEDGSLSPAVLPSCEPAESCELFLVPEYGSFIGPSEDKIRVGDHIAVSRHNINLVYWCE